MKNYQKEITDKVEEYSKLPDGIKIDNPDHRIPVGIFYITNRVIKHFVESRKRQGANLGLLVKHIFEPVSLMFKEVLWGLGPRGYVVAKTVT